MVLFGYCLFLVIVDVVCGLLMLLISCCCYCFCCWQCWLCCGLLLFNIDVVACVWCGLLLFVLSLMCVMVGIC